MLFPLPHSAPLYIYLQQQWKGIFILSIKHISVFIRKFAYKINEKEEKMKADSITSPIRKQGFRASMTVKW